MMVFISSDGQRFSMVEVAFNSLCKRQPGGGGKERRMNATIKLR